MIKSILEMLVFIAFVFVVCGWFQTEIIGPVNEYFDRLEAKHSIK